MSASGIAGMTEHEKREALNRIAIIKLLIQRICTPVSAEKRLSSIRSFFQKNSDNTFSEKENMMIWKGLFYAVWYSEMGKGCEETIEAIVSECQKSEKLLIAGMQTLVNEWKGIDSIRLDKFSFFARRLINAMFRIEVVQERRGQVVDAVISRIRDCTGLLLKFCNVFIEETVSVFEDHPQKFTVVAVLSLIRPVIDLLRETNSEIVQQTIRKEVLIESLVQLTESSFCDHVIRYQKSLNKVLHTYSTTADNRKQEKVITATIRFINDEEELRVVFEAADVASKPKKRSAKPFYRKAKKRVKRVNF